MKGFGRLSLLVYSVAAIALATSIAILIRNNLVDRHRVLLRAATSGDLRIIDKALSSGVDIDAMIRENVEGTLDPPLTLLCAASASGQDEIVQLLLDRGANTELADQRGRTPIVLAAQAGHASIVKGLTDAGAAVDKVMSDGRTPLMYAISSGSAESVRFLIAAGADVDWASPIAMEFPGASIRLDGMTPLIWCVLEESRHIFRTIVDAGASVDKGLRDNSMNPLIAAAFAENVGMIQELMTLGADPNGSECYKYNRRSPLHVSIRLGDVEAVRILLEGGADKTLEDRFGRLPIELARQLQGPRGEEIIDLLK